MMSMNKHEKVTCIIQARTGSKRLENKILKEIENIPMIYHIINRVKKAKNIEQIILATSNLEPDKILLDIAKKSEIIGFAGNENDVLDRFYNATKKYTANPIIRITGDCPLVDPNLLDKMIEFSKENGFGFPYLIDETQEIAKKYDAVCTPDFFGYNKNLELQYRGRIRELKDLKPIEGGESDLLKAMKMIAKTGQGPKEQVPSMGCNIKWFNN